MAPFSIIHCPSSSASLRSSPPSIQTRRPDRLRSASKLGAGFFGASPQARSNLQFAQQSSGSSLRCRSRVPRVNALFNEVSVAGSETDADAAKKEIRQPDVSSISAFIYQVANLGEEEF